MKIKNRMITLALAGLMAVQTVMPVMAAEDTNTTQDVEIAEHVYSVDPFDADYSAGYFCISDSDAHGALKITSDGIMGDDAIAGYNTERQDDIYIDHHNGVCVNGTYYDVREYTWMSADTNVYLIDSATGMQGGSGSSNGNVHREFHFYEAGTLDSENPVEVSFRGVMHLTDMDVNEGFTFDQGFIGIWTSNDTRVTRREGLTWKGTVENGNTDYEEYVRDSIWVEVEGTPEHPLTYTYWYNNCHYSEINYYGNSITYSLVEDGEHALPEGAEPAVGIHCATYASYSLMPATEFQYYAFDGWYYDAALTEKVPDTIMVAEDHTFYGTYHKVAGRIDTKVVNGTITDTIDPQPYGEDAVIAYAPNDGYILESITVDGEPVDITQFPEQYTFADVQEDHSICVTYKVDDTPTPVDPEPTITENNKVINNETVNNKTTNNETVNNKTTNNETVNNKTTTKETEKAAEQTQNTTAAENAAAQTTQPAGTVTTTTSTTASTTTTTPSNNATVSGYRNVATGDVARTGIVLAVGVAALAGLAAYCYQKRR